MATNYPTALDTYGIPLGTDTLGGSTPTLLQMVTNLRDGLLAVEAELGINPSGSLATVLARLDADDAGESVAATVNTVMLRDAAGRSKVVDPAVDADVANRGWTNTAIAALGTTQVINLTATADTSKTDATTFVTATGMSFTPGINTVWAISGVLEYTASATGGVGYKPSYPAGATMHGTTFGYDTSPTTAFKMEQQNGLLRTFGGRGATVSTVYVDTVLTMGATAGTWAWQFRQAALDASVATITLAGSYLIAAQLA